MHVVGRRAEQLCSSHEPRAAPPIYTGGDTSGCGEYHFITGLPIYYDVQSGGVKRTYSVHAPDNYSKTTKYPLIVGFHGSDSIGLWFELDTGLDATKYTGDKIMVYPDRLGGAWAGANYSTATVAQGPAICAMTCLPTCGSITASTVRVSMPRACPTGAGSRGR